MAVSADAAIIFSKSKANRILENLLEEFRTSSQCCMKLPDYLSWADQFKVAFIAQLNELNYCTHQQNGVQYIKVYKKSCNCYPGKLTTFKLTDPSRKIIFSYLKSNPLQQKEKKEMFPYSIDTDLPPKCKVPTYRFSVGTAHNPMLTVPPAANKGYANKFLYPIHQRSSEILDAINKNRVVAIIGDAGYKKSTQVPQFILEDASVKGLHCRIISSHSQRISAISDSDTVASQRGEQVGSTVAYQIHLESKSSAKTNLLFTTTSFLLRCLMSTSMSELFQGVTHIIINELHEMDVYADFLLMELKSNIACHPSVNIILMGSPMNTKIFENYFKSVKVIELQPIKHEVSIIHLEEIIYLTGHMNNLQNSFDHALDNYLLTGNQQAFDYIIHLIQTGQLPVNARQTKTLMTPLIAAVQRNRPDHVRTLIKLKGNPYLVDNDNKSAFDWTELTQSMECNYILLEGNSFSPNCTYSEQLVSAYNHARAGKKGVDHDLLFALISFVNQSFQEGAVLVFLPSYMDLIKQQCMINKGIEAGVLNNIKLYILHESISENEAKRISEVYPTHRKIVLSTKLGESAFLVQYVRFVIDSGTELNINNEYCSIPSDSMKRRTALAGSIASGLCFRLYYKETAESLSTIQKSSFNVNKFSKFSLYVKLLSQYTTVKDYFSNSYKAPPAQVIDASLKLLKDIGAVDADENISNLGIRLVDIPVDLQLGKVLLFAIILQCLDPVLTIVSALAFQEPLNLEDYDANDGRTYISRNALAEGTNSDHMVLLRLYQNWQDKRMPDLGIDLPMNEIILNGLLEAICGLRIQIVGTLRAAGLVHSAGILSMQSLNVHSNNWALVKACFVGGMYPNICKINKKSLEIKTRTDKKIKLYSNSILCGNNSQNVNSNIRPYQTEWIVFQENIITSEGDTNIKWASIVTPLLIALFGGKSKISQDDVNDEIDITAIQNQTNYDKIYTTFNVDEWISFSLLPEDAHLLFNLRQKFFHYFQDLLQNCEIEKLQKNQQSFESKSFIVDVISKVTSLEECANDLPLPAKVGERPKALPMKIVNGVPFNNLKLINDIQHNPFKQLPNQLSSPPESLNVTDITKGIRRFYVINVESKQEGQRYFEKKLSKDHYTSWQKLVQKSIEFPGDEIFVFLLENSSKNFCAVGHMKMEKYDFYLELIAKIDVPYTLLEGMFHAWKGYYDGSFEASEIPPIVGNSFLNCFTGNK